MTSPVPPQGPPTTGSPSEFTDLERWRLMLGEASEGQLGQGCGRVQACDAALGWLYDRGSDLEERDVRGSRGAGSGPSQLSVPDWIDAIHTLFPKETIERLERDAVEEYGIDEVVTNEAVLGRVEPSPALLAAVLRVKHLMNPGVLAMARKLVRRVVEELMKKFQQQIRQSFRGRVDPRRSTPHRSARNLDLKTTLRRNLKHYDPLTRRIILERPYFVARTKKFTERWQIILLVDQSGSMVDSVIHSAVTAACLWGLPGIKTHLCVFDTEVVDLTHQVTDPVETLMKVQLGGGTDIAKAMEYASQLIENPRKAIVCLITDFYEGGDERMLVRRTKHMCEQGTRVLGLAALDPEAVPNYDENLAQRMANAGAHVGAMTPGQLAEFLGDVVRT